MYVKADEVSEIEPKIGEGESSSAEPLGLYTHITIIIEKDETHVCAVAKNEFTLFFSTVHVYAELYSFDTYQTTYSETDLEAREYIEDLNMGKTLTASASINGKSRYWMAVARFQLDGGARKTAQTDAYYVEAN